MKNKIQQIALAGFFLLFAGLFANVQAQTAVCDGEQVILTLSGHSGQI